MGRLWGVGEKTADSSHGSGSRRSGPGDGRRSPSCERLLGEASATHLSRLSHGLDDRDVIPYEAPKSVGHEETFDRDLDDDDEILRELLHLSGRSPPGSGRAATGRAP